VPRLHDQVWITRWALRGGSSNHTSVFRRLAEELPALLRQRMQRRIRRKRQSQRRLTAEQLEQLIADYRAGLDMQALAAHWNLHRTTVAAQLRRAGIELRRQGIPAERLEEAAALYSRGWSCQRLAERYGCHAETVRQVLKRNGVIMRASWERN
jgi:lambda repressor-like predicted transcriptional regulator